ncbi:MAG TPA: putative ABC exporter domain-containing protein [Gemmatimonadales bacterium]|nr:putative ABC exporter domain-containing protein [Gemmatimonadales bacterium]
MIGTFAYLLVRSGRNRLLRQLRRLRQPRYLAALVLGLVYLWFLVLQQRPAAPGADPARAGWIELAATVALAAAVGWAWVFAAERRILAFSPAEVTFLFTAPVTRRHLVHFKLLRTQLVVLFNTLLWTVLLSRERFGASGWLRAASVWAILSTLSLHRLGASFVRASLAEHGRSGARHRVVSLALLAAVLGATGLAIFEARAALASGWDEGIGPFLGALARTADAPMPRAILLPFRLLAAPLVAESVRAWAVAMGPALALLVVHYIWVIRSDAAFEAAAVEESLRRAQRLAERTGPPRRSVTTRAAPPYRLRPSGRPAEAIFWKNLAGVARTGRPRTAAVGLLAAGVVLGALSFRSDGHLAEIAGWFVGMWAAFLVVVGPQWVRSDLRGDLPKLDLLRTFPLTGRSIVAAEVAASTAVLTAMQLGVAGVAYLAFLGNRLMEPPLDVRTAGFAGAVIILPGVNLLGLLVQNTAAVLYPSWVHLGPGRPGGVEALGQNMLALMAHVLVLALALAGPAAAAGAVLLSLEPAIGLWAVVPAALAALLVIALEASAAIGWLGRVFERTDPVSAR